ncbi:hypothetical protein N7539_005902 [Penicillium diatomitis]|uniref:Pentatricopeptide repeat-containing protein-mitochondrial domain-containing protein n=1 Tax=Penicillium diatomitis TaxID=2819901 RepID=A0A9X0BU35_9EURO|nr:uncharacterized protein N7539_005902 [Penicillium diatomitis]KAJ5484106.1 hypothetical protein N7539_005902 [Penicillium diatomitis]
MSRRMLVLDGLWYTLCPSFTPSALQRPNSLWTRRQPSSLTPRRTKAPPRQRCQSTYAYQPDNEPRKQIKAASKALEDIAKPVSASISLSDEVLENTQANLAPRDRFDKIDQESIPSRRKKEVNKWPGIPEYIAGKSNDSLEALLQTEMGKRPNITSATHILRLLIRDRGIQPSARHYKALIVANSDGIHGSPNFVRNLLEEMERYGVAADSGTLHAALQALAVHPDFSLRQEVLQKLRDRWLTLSPSGWHFVVAGLLREHKFEMALEQISLMLQKDIHVESWLHSSIIYNLCDMEELDEVLRLMEVRVHQGHDMTSALWMHVLRTAVEAQHYQLARFVWRRQVELGYLRLPSAACSDVLQLAAENSDLEVAQSIFRYCAQRALTPTVEDFGQLVLAYVGADNVYAAFETLCTIREAGLEVDQSTTLPILSYMIQNKTDRREAWQMLKKLHNDKHEVPLAGIRVIAELCEHDAHHDPTVVDDAVGFYNEIHTLYSRGADLEVYNILIRMCRIAGKREAGIFLVKEMAKLNVIPDSGTFESIILMCLDAGNYKSALMYLLDLSKREGAELSPGAKQEIRKLCAESVNEYALRLQYHPLLQGAETSVSDAGPETGSPSDPTRPLRHKLGREERIAYNKERRQRKRRRLALERIAAEGQASAENSRCVAGEDDDESSEARHPSSQD